jgi:exodeoxyribonuclease V alpha subunit
VITPTEPFDDPHDARVAAHADGMLRELNVAGVLEAVDLHVARRVTALAGDSDPLVALAVAVAVRAVRTGSVCVRLREVAASESVAGAAWPDAAEWLAAVAASPLTGDPSVLHLEDDRLYLDRYWREEVQVCDDLLSRPRPATGSAPALPGLDRVFPAIGYDEQRAAAALAATQPTTVLTGGPGTGKTTAVAGLLALLAEAAADAGHPALRIALAAPTGKAAARLQEAVRREVGRLPDADDRARLDGLTAMTLHRLLGVRPDTAARFRHHRDNRLPHDVVVVDESSMVSLTMMARLLEALRPEARLVLVGDPDQLASVEAGAVLADLVDGLGARSDVRIARLETSHRFGESIGALAGAVREGREDDVLALLRAGGDRVVFDETDDPAEALRPVLLPRALQLREAAEAGDVEAALALLERHRLLCAHRDGPFGVRQWNREVERWISEETGEGIWSAWYPGRPFLVTANDYGLGIFNGDAGVAVGPAGSLRAHVAAVGGHVDLATSRVSDVDTMHAMTIHKSQGSQAQEITVLLPPPDSRLLTRELLYTALTRAESLIRVVGTEESVRSAVQRQVSRASGLAERLRDGHHPVGET